LLFHPALKVDESGEISMEGSVLEHPPDDDANQRKSFGPTGLVVDSLSKVDRKALSVSTNARLVASITGSQA
jgi:hypothetical protein